MAGAWACVIYPTTFRWRVAFPIDKVLELISEETRIENFMDHVFVMAINGYWRWVGLVSVGELVNFHLF